MMYLVVYNVQKDPKIRDAIVSITESNKLKLDAFVRRLHEATGSDTLTGIIGRWGTKISQDRLNELLDKPLYHDAILYPIKTDGYVDYEGAMFAPYSDEKNLQFRLFE